MDVQFENHGTIILVRPVSQAAQDWIKENVETEAWQWFGGALACEPRMAPALAEGMADAGLEVTAGGN